MKHRDLNAAITSLRRWQANEISDQDQKEAFDRIIRALRKLSRNDKPNKTEVLEVVRRICETLWKAVEKK